MTDQPTTWTPDRALADRIAHAIDAIHHIAVRNPRDGGERMRRAKDVLIGIVSEVVASRESAAAEIERQKARASGLAADLAACVVRADAAEKEVERLRAELAAMTQQRDVYCKEMLDAMKATKPAAKEGPSDERIAMHIEAMERTGGYAVRGEVAAGLRLLARRAGVKL